MSTKTFMAKEHEVERQWWVVDATDRPLGRLATEVAKLLRGKHKPIFTPHVDTGDHVIVINAEKVALTGNKRDEKIYRHSQYPGGLKSVTRGELLDKRPTRLVERTIKGMLPHNRLGADLYRKLKVYAGPEHPHQGQKPELYEFRPDPRQGRAELSDPSNNLYATGHRKNATAKVWLIPGGSGAIEVNRRPLPDYVQRRSLELLVTQPLEVTETVGEFDVRARVLGGGIAGQAGAIRHGISKALLLSNPELRPTLRKHGFLTRDSRVKERKKYGRKRARRGFQFSKR